MADVSTLLRERITFQRVKFYTYAKCQKLYGIEAMCFDNIAGMTSQRRVHSPGTGGQQEVCTKFLVSLNYYFMIQSKLLLLLLLRHGF